MKYLTIVKSAGCLAICFSLTSCGKKFNPADGASPPAQVIDAGNSAIVTVEKPEQFPLATAERYDAPDKLDVTGSVTPDIAREVPVISLASGRVVDIRAQLDDNVKKGQILLRVQSPDITNAYDAYLKTVNDEQLTNSALIRTKDLYAHGAISLGSLEQAQNAEKDAKADLDATAQQLQTLGVRKDHPSSIVNVYAPISGVVIAQNVTNAAAAGVTYTGSSTLFTIADLSRVWIICDVYENDLPKIRLGQTATIRLSAYPNKVLSGRVSDIGPILDPTLRTAKVRIEVPNSGILRLGMFVTATLTSQTKQTHAIIPASAILHLHDRDWVFVPEGSKKFQRVEVEPGDTLPGNRQEILSGIVPGQQVVANVLAIEETLEAQ